MVVLVGDADHQFESQESGEDALSIASAGTKLLALLRHYPVVILVAETGVGKSTRIPPLLWRTGGYDRIGCTQPRRLAATTLASRVATELGVTLGREVGYCVRFDDRTTPGVTHIKYITDGWLLRELARDPVAFSYDVLMVDDAHERSLASDIVLALLRRLLFLRRDSSMTSDLDKVHVPRVIISSATMNAAQFASYFQGAPVLRIAGRTYPVRIAYAASMPPDYVTAAVSQVMAVYLEWCQTMSLRRTGTAKGADVLVFLTGQEEIERAAELIHHQTQHVRALTRLESEHPAAMASSSDEQSGSQSQGSYGEVNLEHTLDSGHPENKDQRHRDASPPIVVTVPLYGALPSSEQLKVCSSPPPPNTFRVILATNVAETSLTIPHVTTVIDSGYVKQRLYDRLEVVPISQASARQRTGRAGRTAPGTCYRLYTEEFYTEQMVPETIPEIQRVDLSQSLLLLKSMGVVDLNEITWLDAPDPANVHRSLALLRHLGALTTDTDNDVRPDPNRSNTRDALTDPIGRRMAQMPLEPRMARALIAAEEYGCTKELVSAFAILSTGYHLFTRRGLAEAVPRFCRTDQSQLRDPLAYNDFLLFARVFEAWQTANCAPDWCHRQGVHYRVLRLASDIRRQLSSNVQQPLSSNPPQTIPALYAGFQDQTAKLTRRGAYLREQRPLETASRNVGSTIAERTSEQPMLHIHPTSCLYRREWAPPRLLFYELIISKQPLMRCVCAIASEYRPSRRTTRQGALLPNSTRALGRRRRWSVDDDNATRLSVSPRHLASKAGRDQKPVVLKRSRWDKV